MMQKARSRLPPGAVPLLGSIVLMFFSVFTGVAIAPIAAEAAGRSSDAGLITGLFAATTVATQLWMPRMLSSRHSPRILHIAFVLLVLSNVPFVAWSESSALLFAGSAARGVGFGVTAVMASLLVNLAEPSRRGEMMAYFGVAATIPGIAAPALGLYLQAAFGLAVPSVLSAVCAIGGLSIAVTLSLRTGEAQRAGGLLGALRGRSVLLPFLVSGAASAAFGGLISFVPLVLTGPGIESASLFFLGTGIWRALARWQSSRLADRRRPASLLTAGPLLAIPGAVALAAGSGAWFLVAAALLGIGIGIIQNISYLAMLDAVEPHSYGLIATLWNISLDGGVMVGALGLAMLEQAASLTAVLWSLALIFVAGAPLAAMAAGSAPAMSAETQP
ncbi:MAG: MFS transporter [Gemmatimonadetes bacterium]|nr:MFS transporter [Gemmatimonadota bacterium]